MTYFSLKRTLLQYLNSAAEPKYKGTDNEFTGLLHNSGKPYSTMLRIGKSPTFCHPDIPLKKTHQVKSVIYASAISRKLEKNWQQPASQVAKYLLNVLKNASKPLSVRLTLDHQIPLEALWYEFSLDIQQEDMLCFELSTLGLWYWLRRLTGLAPVNRSSNPAVPISSACLWQVQYIYGRCAFLKRQAQALGLSQPWSTTKSNLLAGTRPLPLQTTLPQPSALPFLLPEAQVLLHELITAVDTWEVDAWLRTGCSQTWSLNTKRLSQRVIAVSQAFEQYDRAWSSNYGHEGMAPPYWQILSQVTWVVLNQLGMGNLGWQLADQL